MTVADLITLLQSHDPARLVVMRLAKGGCNCSPLREVKVASYIESSPWIGAAYPGAKSGAEAAVVLLAEY